MINPPLRIACFTWLLAASLGAAADESVSLPKPRTSGGKPLLQSLKERKSSREIKPDALPPQVLSDLLWAAFGINRPENDHRTAPSAMNLQEIDLYVATADGVFVYEAKPHRLKRVAKDDIRAKTTGQAELKVAPVALLYVMDQGRMAKARPEWREAYANFDAGCISQNVALFCASEGLANVVHDLDRASLAPLLKLRPDQKIVMAHSVGFPK